MLTRNYSKLWYALFPIVLLLFLADLSLGSVNIPLPTIWKILIGFGDTENESWQKIITVIRLPRVITALIVGGSLSLSGLQMQTLFRNPLAGPFVLGITSGASLGVALTVLAGASTFGLLAVATSLSITIALSASIGAGLVMILVIAVAQKVPDTSTLLILGIMFASLAGATVSVLEYFSSAEAIQGYLMWTFGSLGGVSWSELPIMATLCIIGLITGSMLFKPLNALLLGEKYAESMGVNIKKTRNITLVSTSLMAGAVTAFCGPIAFIGIAVPHITRALFGFTDHKILIPATVLVGCCLMLVCDIISQLPGSSHMLPINAVTSLFGAPVVIWVVLKKQGLGHSFN